MSEFSVTINTLISAIRMSGPMRSVLFSWGDQTDQDWMYGFNCQPLIKTSAEYAASGARRFRCGRRRENSRSSS